MAPEIAVAFEGRFSRELRETGVPVHVVGPARASRPHTVLRARRRLRNVLQGIAFDAVVSHGPWAHATFGPAVRRAGIPLVFWGHGLATGRHWIERWAARTRPALAIANSQFTAATLPLMFPECRHLVIHYPVAPSMTVIDDLDRRRVRRDATLPQDSLVILQVSRLEPWKGHRTLIEALGILGDRGQWLALIVGYPQTPLERAYQDNLRTLARSLGIEHRLRFHQTTDSVRPLFDAADVFCQPNAGPEPFGIVFVEAMLAGLPVVTSDLGGPREFIDESCGVRLPPGDSRALAAALGHLLDDSELRRRMGEAGQQRAREWFNPARQLSLLAEALAQVVSVPVGASS